MNRNVRVRHKPLALAAAVLFLCWTEAAHSQRLDFTQWNESECRKIIRNHTQQAKATLTTGLIHNHKSIESFRVLWMSDPAIKAIARLQQLREKRPASEAQVLYAALRGQMGRDRHWFLIPHTSSSVRVPSLPDLIAMKFNPNISLRNKTKERASGVKESRPLEVVPLRQPLQISGFGRVLVFGFDKTTDAGKPLVDSMNDEIQLSIPSAGGGLFQAKFRLEKLLASVDDL